MSAPRSARGGPREGAGRPVGPDGRARRIDTRIPEALLDRLADEALRRGVTRSKAIVQAIRDWLGETDRDPHHR